MATWDITTAAASLEFDTQNGANNSCAQIDSNHFINFWLGGAVTTDGFVQVFTVNTSTWAVTTAAASLVFDTDFGNAISCYKIDTNHFITFWSSSGQDGFVQTFTVNTTTWAVTTAAASLEFDTTLSLYNSCAQIDSNHFINFWQITGSDGGVQTFTVNTTTWAVTTAAAPLEFDTQNSLWNSCAQIDSNHFINFWLGGAVTTDGFVQVFTVNTSTWAVTTAAASKLFDTDVGSRNACAQIDSNHFINFWQGPAGDGFAQVFTVNTSTWAVTTAAASLEFDTQNYSNGLNSSPRNVVQIDSNHFMLFWLGGAATTDGFTQVFEVNTTTWAVTTAAASKLFDTDVGSYSACLKVDSSHFINFWQGPAADGFTQVFTVAIPVAGSQIKTVNGLAIASVKTKNDLAIASVKTINGLTNV